MELIMEVVDRDSAWYALDAITEGLADVLGNDEHDEAVHAAFLSGFQAAVAWPEWALLLLKAAYPDGELERNIGEVPFMPLAFPVEIITVAKKGGQDSARDVPS